MRWPLDNFEITTYYNSSHQAYDLAAPLGTPALATTNGVVSSVGTNPNYIGGRYIIIRSDDGGYGHYTGHFNATHVSVGQKVSEGQHIADVGQTGQATGSHIHFQVRDLGGNLVGQEYYQPLFKGVDMLVNDFGYDGMNRFHHQIVGNWDMAKDYWDSIQGRTVESVLLEWTVHPDSNKALRQQELGEYALRDDWVKQIHTLEDQVNELSKAASIKDGEIERLTKETELLKAQTGDSGKWGTLKSLIRELFKFN